MRSRNKKARRATRSTVVQEIRGQAVLLDAATSYLVGVVEKLNCQRTLELHAERVAYFKTRMEERGLTANEAVIVVLNVDDVHGGQITEMLMPGPQNWQEIRDRGEIPFARGIAMREGIQEILSEFDKEAAKKLAGMKDVAVVVVDRGVAEIFIA
jgi:hypothetical protein